MGQMIHFAMSIETGVRICDLLNDFVGSSSYKSFKKVPKQFNIYHAK